MINSGDVLKWLDVALKTHSVTYDYSVIKDAIEEIERLRAGQFRWIPVTEPTIAHRSLVLYSDGNSCVQGAGGTVSGATYYIPIPPLPERTQEEKDEALWERYRQKNFPVTGTTWAPTPRQAYIAGLKAARGEK